MSYSQIVSKAESDTSLPYDLKDYLELVDWTGRFILEDKKGYINNMQPKPLQH